MKKIIMVGLLFGSLNLAHAVSAPAGMIGANVLDGTYAYLWNPGVTALNIASATLSFTSIRETATGSGNNISTDFGSFWTGTGGIGSVLVAGGTFGANFSTVPGANAFTTVNDHDTVGDAFSNIGVYSGSGSADGKRTYLGSQSFANTTVTNSWSYTFTADQLIALNAYIATGHAWGFEIDADCHFNVGGIDFTYTQGTPSVPDATGTFGLLGLATVGLIAYRRKLSIQTLRVSPAKPGDFPMTLTN